MTTVTDYLDSARVSLVSAIEEADGIDPGEQSDNDTAKDLNSVINSLRDALRELETAIRIIG